MWRVQHTGQNVSDAVARELRSYELISHASPAQPPPYTGKQDPTKCPLWDSSIEGRHNDEVSIYLGSARMFVPGALIALPLGHRSRQEGA